MVRYFKAFDCTFALAHTLTKYFRDGYFPRLWIDLTEYRLIAGGLYIVIFVGIFLKRATNI